MRPEIFQTLRKMRAEPELVFDYYITTDDRRTQENFLNVLPELSEQYGQTAKGAARYMAPFLLSDHSQAALYMLETITGSHEYAEAHLKQIISHMPSSPQAEKALHVLKIIATVSQQQKQSEVAGAFEYRGYGSYAPGGYTELLRKAELRQAMGVRRIDVPDLIAQLKSAEREQVKKALMGLQALGTSARSSGSVGLHCQRGGMTS